MVSKSLEKIKMNFSIVRNSDNTAELKVEELKDVAINFADESVEDIKNLFEKIFDYIVSEKKIIEFELKDDKNDLFTEISQEIVNQLNSEITQSEENFKKILELENQK